MEINKSRIDSLRRDEAQAKSFGCETEYLILSLSCKHHCSSHGELINFNDAQKLYNIESLQDDCKCALALIILDDNGEPLSSGVITQARAQIPK